MTDLFCSYIGHVESPFSTKFSVPRQPGLAKAIEARVILDKSIDFLASTRALESFSHLWILFHFHDQKQNWKPMVTPPRLGGKKKVGVFASRSPFRPNPVGLSVVRLVDISKDPKSPWIKIAGADFVNQTPILDIKPYLPYADCLQNADSGWLQEIPATRQQKKNVLWSKQAKHQLQQADNASYLKNLVDQVLELDPRPAHHIHTKKARAKGWQVSLADYDVRWISQDESFLITSIEKLTD